MGSNLSSDMPVAEAPTYSFGREVKKQFLFDPKWTNLNHGKFAITSNLIRLLTEEIIGSFGSIPKVIRDRLRFYQDACEARPDKFIRYEYPRLLDEGRQVAAELVNAPLETIVFVQNATVGVNTVFRNLKWSDDGKDVVLTFSTVYEACGKTVDCVVDYNDGLVTSEEIELAYPIEDKDIIDKFRDTVREIEHRGKRVKACMFDVVSSRPGVPFPWHDMVQACRELGVLSVVDGAQGIGMVPLDLSAADPDFFVSNCHKWLHVPRACAIFYVPIRNQHLLPSTVPTSHGYQPKLHQRISPLPPNSKSHFVNNFEYVGTLDNAPYLCVADAIKWRKTTFGGEDRILAYLWDLNKKGSSLIASKLGTHVLDNAQGTMTNCAMGNVALPLWTSPTQQAMQEGGTVIPTPEINQAFQWMLETMVEEYQTFIAMYLQDNRLWARISAQVYIELKDYEWAAETLSDLCARVAKKEYIKQSREN